MLLKTTDTNNPWEKFSDWGDNFVHQLPNIITAIVFIIIIYFLSGIVNKIAKRIMRRKSNPAIATVMASFFSFIFVLIGIFIALGILGLDQTVTSLLAGAGIMGLVLGLALQDTLSSALAGIIMTTRKSYKVGDFVESNNYLGTIVEINLRNTTVRQTNGVDVKIPNKLVLSNPLINYSLRGERRISVNVGIGYNENLQQVEKIIRSAFQNVNYNNKKDLEIFFTEFASSSINILIRFWISKFKQADFLQAQSEAITAIKKSFDDNKIIFPYPVHVVEIKK